VIECRGDEQVFRERRLDGSVVGPAGADEAAHAVLGGDLGDHLEHPRGVEHRHRAEAEVDRRLAGLEPGRELAGRRALAEALAERAGQGGEAGHDDVLGPLRGAGREVLAAKDRGADRVSNRGRRFTAGRPSSSRSARVAAIVSRHLSQ
jgi:hypothetical protein